jgi:hypothetical protein
MKSYVAGSWYRALNARLNENAYALKWGLTATEHLQMFELLPFCLHNLVSLEVTALNTSPHRPNGATLVIDPSRDIIYAVCSVLDWYELAMSPKHTARTIQQTGDKAWELMHLLKDIFKSRHVGIPGTSGERTAEENERSKGPWNFPKFHALIHIAIGLWLFGRYSNTCHVHTPAHIH